MTQQSTLPTAETVRSLLDYNEVDGTFVWLVERGPVKKGYQAGSPNKAGYLQIQIQGRKYRANRLAWLWVHGHWPTGDVDHIDGNVINDSIINLRDVSRTLNMQNRRRAQVNNKAKLLGVSLHYGKYEARIRINGKQVHIGRFETAEEAHQSYIDAKRASHEGNTL